jgi:hypothetical protein
MLLFFHLENNQIGTGWWVELRELPFAKRKLEKSFFSVGSTSFG